MTAVVSLSESREPNDSLEADVVLRVVEAELEWDDVDVDILVLISSLVVGGGRSGLLLAVRSLTGEARQMMNMN